jgi:hypothetical protein
MYNILKSVTNNGLITYKENDIYKPIFDYYNQSFRNYINIDFNNKNLSFIVQYASIEMNTCFENNIMLHSLGDLSPIVTSLCAPLSLSITGHCLPEAHPACYGLLMLFIYN